MGAKIHETPSCTIKSSEPKTSWIQNLSDWTTFTEKGKQEILARKQAEKEAILKETARLCEQEREKIEISKVPTADKIKKRYGILAESDAGMMIGLNLIKTPDGKNDWIINYQDSLDALWKKKLKRLEGAKNQNPEDLLRMRNFYEQRIHLTQWKDFQPTSYRSYEKRVITAMEDVKRNRIPLEETLDKYLIPRKSPAAELATQMIKDIGSNDLIGLSMTELFGPNPINTPLRNRAMLENILAYGWEKYLMLLPAMGDNLLSYGPYQHTKFSINGESAGARLADLRFTKGKILNKEASIENIGDISQIHHQSAYLLLLHNAITLAKNIPEEYEIVIPSKKKGRKKKPLTQKINLLGSCLGILKKNPSGFKNAMTEYHAAAHNNPSTAKAGFIKWILEAESNEQVGAEGNIYKYIEKDSAKNNAKAQGVHKESIDSSSPVRKKPNGTENLKSIYSDGNKKTAALSEKEATAGMKKENLG